MQIQDQTHTLSQQAIDRLESIGYSFNPKVFILSKSPDNLGDYAHQLGGQLISDELIMVIDIPGRKVRTLSGPSLTDRGVDGSLLKQMQDQCFVPNMRKKDLEGAIRESLGFVESKVTKSKQVEVVQPIQPVTVINQVPTNTHVDLNPGLGVIFFVSVVITLAVYACKKAELNFKIGQKTDQFEEEQRKIVNLTPELETNSSATKWFLDCKDLMDRYSLFKLKRRDNSDSLVTISGLYERACILVKEGKELVRKEEVKIDPNIFSRPPSKKVKSSDIPPVYTEPTFYYSAPPRKKETKKKTETNITYNSFNYTDCYSKTSDNDSSSSTPKKHSSSSSSDSGSSGWSSGSSSDSGSSGWSSGSSSDSGSSGFSGGSDAGSSGW